MKSMKKKTRKMADGGSTGRGVGNPNSGVTSNEKYPEFTKINRGEEAGLGASEDFEELKSLLSGMGSQVRGYEGADDESGPVVDGKKPAPVSVGSMLEPYVFPPGMRKGGKVGGFRRVADGIAQRGKTKGRMV